MPIIRKSTLRSSPTIEAALYALEPFVPDDLTLTITSGVRGPQDQLRVIAGYAAKKGCLQKEFDPQDVDGQLQNGQYYWHTTWTALLMAGVIINPPHRAICDVHYIRKSTGEDMYMKWIEASPHESGHCFDEEEDPADVPRKIEVLEKAKAAGAPIVSWLIERENGCLHVNCVPV